MAPLQEKYKAVIDAANANGVTNLQLAEQDGVLHIDGEVPSGDAKDKIWSAYETIDPSYSGGDLVLNVNVSAAGVSGASAKVTTDHSNLNIRKGPGTDQPIVGKAAHGSNVTVISKTNDQWWLIKTDDGVEGYAYAQYLGL